MTSRFLSTPILALAGALCLCGPSQLAGLERFEIHFDSHLGTSDLRLEGPKASRRLDFFCEREWNPAPGSELHLFIEHSPDLDGERSFLSVSLNHGILRSLRLDERNRALTKVVIPLPAEMIKESNQLVLTVEQSGASDTDRVSTVIRSSSYISIVYERAPVAWSLADLPEPLLLLRSYRPRKLTLLLPSEPSVTTLEATALVIASLTARVAPAPVELAFVRSVVDAPSPVLAVGTPGELPALWSFLQASSLELLSTPEGPVVAKDGRALAASEGVMTLLPAGPRRQSSLLWLTGNGAEAVLNVAKGLFRVERPEGEAAVRVPEGAHPPPKPLRQWRGFMPPANRFALKEAGDQEAELAVASDTPARVRLRAPPDARFFPWGHNVRLAFRTLPGLLEDPEASLQIYWNGTLLREDPVERVATGAAFSVPVMVPAAVLRADNVLTVAWSGLTSASGPFVMLQEDSEFYLPREYVAELPDLARLREFFYPFSLQPDLSDVVVVAPEGGGDDVVEALSELAALFGRLVPTDTLAFRVKRASELPPEKSKIHLIWLEVGDGAPELPPIEWNRIPGGPAAARLPILLERPSPWSRDKYLLRLRASSPALLRAAVRGLAAPPVLERLSGDTALLAAEGPQCSTLEPRRRVAQISYLARLEAWLRSHWLALPLILAAISGLLFVGLRLALGHYRGLRAGARGGAAASGSDASPARMASKGVSTRR